MIPAQDQSQFISPPLHGFSNEHAPEISATLRLRYSTICSGVSFVVNGVGTSAMSAGGISVVGVVEVASQWKKRGEKVRGEGC